MTTNRRVLAARQATLPATLRRKQLHQLEPRGVHREKYGRAWQMRIDGAGAWLRIARATRWRAQALCGLHAFGLWFDEVEVPATAGRGQDAGHCRTRSRRRPLPAQSLRVFPR
ncbi:hypothetical protein Veis_1787 [Verminephrobacter eiseniae EF01-2]|uniref:Uncharacterized protein n=1 Tax=Verminephrobacter eiseniae (strain EF01-2) TaxID=391735 RepID=A1WIT4_VEREI|nr:hypothetical protein Veis_1787 [Verminephrobacter eiseniae EF01-2]